MVEIDPGLDTRLRAFFEHYEGEAMPSRLATFNEEAKPKGRPAVQFVAGAVGVAVIAAAAAVFAVELSSHNHTETSPPGQSSVTQRPSPPATWDPFTAPPGSKTLVPATIGTGKVRLPAFTPTEPYVYIDLYCTGGGSLEITSQPEQGAFPDPSSCLGASSIGAFGSDEFMSGPITLSVDAPASSRWQILIYETDHFFDSVPVSPSAMPAAWGTFTAPPGAKTLVAATRGTGTVTLPTFTPTEWYYIVSNCTGGGSMVISSQPAEGGPGESSCLSPGLNTGANDFAGPVDEVMGEPLTLTVTAPASSNWEILVYETNQPDGT